MKAIVDRIENHLAVLLLKPDEKIQFTLPSDAIPGIEEGDIVEITVTKDENETRKAGIRSTELVEKLKKC
ncbi:MAG TPA: DUF3006 domain-containing protein [Methanoregulaceae archaeon]|nr:DUF3006 domain-containing protein [Methanoregulaceae archaeon]